MEEKDYNLDLDSVLKETDIDTIDLYSKESKTEESTNDTNNNLNSEKVLEQIQKISKEFIPIEKTMMIEEIVTTYPDVVPVLMDYGVHCVGCGGASFETLEEGLMGHGAGSDDVDGVVFELNEFLKDKFKKEKFEKENFSKKD